MTSAGRLKLDSVNTSRLLLRSGGTGFLALGPVVDMSQIANPVITAVMKATAQNLIDGDTLTASVTQGFDASPSTALTNGTGANQFDVIWSDQSRTLNASATETIDVYDLGSIDIGAGAGLDALGQAVANAEIVGLVVSVDASSSGTLLIGGEGSGAAWNSPFNGSDTAVLGPIGANGCVLILNPVDPAFAVADTTNHLLKFAEAGGASSVTYSVGIIARSA